MKRYGLVFAAAACCLALHFTAAAAPSAELGRGMVNMEMQRVYLDADELQERGYAKAQLRVAYVNDNGVAKRYLLVYSQGETFIYRDGQLVNVRELAGVAPVVVKFLA